MASYLDQIHAFAVAVLRSKNQEDTASLVSFFHERFSGFESEGHWVPEADECTAVLMSDRGFTLSFGKRHIHYSSCHGRWHAAERADDEPQLTDAHHVAVSKLGAPFAFLEGLQFGIECVAAAGVAAVKNKQASVAASEMERAVERYVLWRTEAKRMERRVKSKHFQKMAKELSAATWSVGDEMPDPPEQTTTVEIARAAFAETPGIYFLWGDSEIEYVGRANRIGKRISPSHHRLQPHHRVSIIEMPASESWVAECYYIWKYRPVLNGQVAKFREAIAP
jgi:hypothetical protein